MQRARLIALLFLLASFFLSCGRKGPLQPPIVRIPAGVEETSIFQRGDKVFIEWNLSREYSDGSPMETIREIEIWYFSGEKEDYPSPLPLDKFKKEADLLEVIKEKELSCYCFETREKKERCRFIYSLNEDEILDKSFTFGLIVKDKKGKESPFSSLLFIIPKVLPLPPENVSAEIVAEGISLTWEPADQVHDIEDVAEIAGYNVYRRGKEDSFWEKVNNNLVTGTSYIDENVQFGQTYFYVIRAVVSKKAPYEESDNSEEVKIIHRDIFPPSPPRNLTAVATSDSVSLSWRPGSESEPAGFRVWRRKEKEEDFHCLTPEPFFNIVYEDKQVEPGTVYYYTITAVDQAGNESDKSNEISVIIRRESHEDL